MKSFATLPVAERRGRPERWAEAVGMHLRKGVAAARTRRSADCTRVGDRSSWAGLVGDDRRRDPLRAK